MSKTTERAVEIIQPKNNEQAEAIEKGKEFIKSGDADDFFVIGGKAGTGKTTIAEAIISEHINKKNILVCALSHKAKLVITEKILKSFGSGCIVSKSVAGALGMNMNNETGKFVINQMEALQPPIKRANIILVDEASMINEESHHLIMTEKKKKAKVIYLGDIRQLPPIREQDHQKADKPSPVFFGKNYAILHERIRQGEESPILPFADYFGDNSRLTFPRENPVPSDKRKNIVNEKGALVFADNIDDVIETVLPLYKKAVDAGNMNIIKTVTYRNNSRKYVNSLVRAHLFGIRESATQFLKGDLLMFNDNFTIESQLEPISNSFEIQVTSAIPQTREYKVWEISFIYESRPVSVFALDETEVNRHAADVSAKFRYAKQLPFGEERKEALSRAWELKNRYAPLEYAYAITSHKSQGSTYNTVVVDELDIMSVKPISNKQKSQSLYTAITRASATCIVIDGQPIDGMLNEAVKFSEKTLNENHE